MKNTQILLLYGLSAVLFAISVVAVIALGVTTAYAENPCISGAKHHVLGGTHHYVHDYSVELWAERGVATTFTLSDVASDFVDQLALCGVPYRKILTYPVFRRAGGSVGGTTIRNAFITITATEDRKKWVNPVHGVRNAPPHHFFVRLDVIVNACSEENPCPESEDEQTTGTDEGEHPSDIAVRERPSDGGENDQDFDTWLRQPFWSTGAIRPGYITCLVAEREGCGTINEYARSRIGTFVQIPVST